MSSASGLSSSRPPDPPVQELNVFWPDNDTSPDSSDPTHILADSPIPAALLTPTRLSFKRKSKPPTAVGTFLSSITGATATATTAGASASASSPASDLPPPRSPRSPGMPHVSLGSVPSHAKDDVPLDWLADGSSRQRVGYEDLTAIDWIFETTKERQRLRALASSASAKGLAGYVAQLADASQVWIILIGTGLVVGALAACIDVATAWLGDLKMGFCSGGADGGSFFLNRNFCCLGYDSDVGKMCADWTDWSDVLHAGSGGSGWVAAYFMYILLSVLFAGLAAALVREYALFAKHSGIPELKTVLGGFVMHDFLSGWTLAAKSLGLCLAVGSGLWLGKEGPLVHVACCVASQFIRLFPVIDVNEARKREVLAAAAAAGISVAFGSPIGGVLFSIETLSYFPDKTMWHAFVCAMTAAVMLQAFDPFRSGKLVLYQSKYTVDWHDFELVPYVLIGIFGGIYGGLFVRLNMLVQRWKQRLAADGHLPSPIKQVLAIALITAVINFPNFYMKVPTSKLVMSLFTECAKLLDDELGLCKTGAASFGTIVLLLFAATLAFILAAVTFGLQIPAGILLPSIAIGALVGRSVGIAMELWAKAAPNFILFASCAPDLPCVTPATYAVVGAAAALAGVTRMTVSIVVIMFELTGALTFVLPIMVAVMLSKWVGDALSAHSIYESWIRLNGYPLIASEGSSAATRVPPGRALDHMARIEDLAVLPATGHSIASLQHVLSTTAVRGFPVVADIHAATLLGYISRFELTYALRVAVAAPSSGGLGLDPDAEAVFTGNPLSGASSEVNAMLDLRPWMDSTPLTLSAHAPMQLVVTYFQKLGVRYMLFVDRGALQGLLTRKDIWYILDGAQGRRGAMEDVGLGRFAEEAGAEQRDGLLRSDGGHHHQRTYSMTSEPENLL